jgi:putative solute:sodium symporter small subunit
MAQPSQANTDEHWKRTTKLMLTHLSIWFFFGYVIHMFVNQLNAIKIPILGFPLGFYMAAQGSLFIYLALIWYYNRRMRQLDAEYGIDDTAAGG